MIINHENPNSVVVDPSGKFAIVTNGSDDNGVTNDSVSRHCVQERSEKTP